MPQSQPVSKSKRIAAYLGMIIFTAFTGFLFGFLGAIIGASIVRGDLFGFGALAGALGGMMVGYPLGVIIGIILVNKLLHYPGSLWLGVLGSILGAAITMGLAEPLNLNLNQALLFTGFFLAPPVLGTTGFHLKIKKAVRR